MFCNVQKTILKRLHTTSITNEVDRQINGREVDILVLDMSEANKELPILCIDIRLFLKTRWSTICPPTYITIVSQSSFLIREVNSM